MTTHIIAIGNSKGVRIPKAMLEESGIEGEVELFLKGKQIVISPKRKARENWEKMYNEAKKRGDDLLTDEDKQWLDTSISSEADKEWVW
jgi:antitoxin MazE